MSAKKIVLSGIRPTGPLHIGHYFSVLKRFAERSADASFQCFYFIADLHALTDMKDVGRLREYTRNIALDMLAAGVNPNTSTIYVQSAIPEVSELQWLLSCVSSAGKLQGMPTYKDKAAKQEDPSAGLFMYPVLMAADILGIKSTHVPVGKDQAPHVEFARSVARRFNSRFGETFPIPDPLTEEMIMIPGLSAMRPDGSFPKMGKTERNTIDLLDSSEEIQKKIKRAPTDPAKQRRGDAGTPEHCGIYQLQKLVAHDLYQDVAEQGVRGWDIPGWGACHDPVARDVASNPEAARPQVRIGSELDPITSGCKLGVLSCGDCKRIFCERLERDLKEFRERRKLIAHEGVVDDVLEQGNRNAGRVIAATCNEVKRLMGL